MIASEVTSLARMGLLEGRRGLVTGAGSGIGRATCRRMAEEGATVAVLDVEADRAEAVAKEVDGLAFAVDVTDAQAMVAAAREASSQMGGLTLLFNNAGTSFLAPLHDFPPEEWARIVGINLTGVFNGFRACIPHILASGGGSIVSTASISGTRPAAGEAPYSAAKAGVVALTAGAALEYGPAIRVNSVSPGMIRTRLTGPLLDDLPGQQARLAAQTPLQRIGEPGDVADVVVFLFSDLARFITGQNLVVDGGMTLHGAGVDGLLDYLMPDYARGLGREPQNQPTGGPLAEQPRPDQTR
jgi:NAD(P)-dependent dehydrogenase (short-subunit alcohol dehydrogenase family)